MKATHQPSFEYADSILTKWHTSNIRNSEDIRKADAQFEAGKAAKSSKSGVIKQNANRFNNYQQRPKKSDDWYNSLLCNYTRRGSHAFDQYTICLYYETV